MTKSINFSTFKNISALLILSALMVALLIPTGASADEGRKGLNAVNVKTSVTKQAGDPIPDIDITVDSNSEGALTDADTGDEAGTIKPGARVSVNLSGFVVNVSITTPNGSTVVNILKGKLP